MHPGHRQDFSLWEFCHAQLSSTEHPQGRTFCSFFEEAVPGLTVLSQPNPEDPGIFTCVSLPLRITPFLRSRVPQASWKGLPSLRCWGAGLPRHLPCLYIFQSFNLSPHHAPSHPCSSNLPVVMRCPVPTTALQVPPTRAPNQRTAGLADTSCLFCSFFFFPLQSSSFKIKITRKGKATEIKI